MDYGPVIRVKRKLLRMSLRDLDARTGISYGQLGKFERGDENPSLEALEKIGKILDINFKEYDEKDKEIEDIFSGFKDALLYYQETDYYLNIVDRDLKYIHCPNFYKMLLMKYILYLLDGRKQMVLNEIEKVLGDSLDGDEECNQFFHHYLGLKYSMSNQFDKANEEFEYALTLRYNESEYALIYYHLGQCCLRDDRALEAFQHFTYAKKLFLKNSNYKRTYFCDAQLASVHSRLGQNGLAIKQYERCLLNLNIIDNDPKIRGITLRNMSWVLIKTKKYEEAIQYLGQAEEIDATNENLIIHYVWCYYKLGNHLDAIKWLLEGKRLFKKDSLNHKKMCLFDELCRTNYNSKKILQLAIQIFDEIVVNYDYELKIFYLDIILEQLICRDEREEALKYAMIKIELLENH